MTSIDENLATQAYNVLISPFKIGPDADGTPVASTDLTDGQLLDLIKHMPELWRKSLGLDTKQPADPGAPAAPPPKTEEEEAIEWVVDNAHKDPKLVKAFNDLLRRQRRPQ